MVDSEGRFLSKGVRAAAATGFVLAATAWVAASAGELNPWSLTHWVFDYSHGFERRSLVGAALGAFFGPDGKSTAVVFLGAWSVLLLCAAAVSAIAVRTFLRRGDGASLALLVVPVSCPLVFGLMSYDKGRMDWVELLVALAAVLPLASSRPAGPAWSVWAAVACCVGVLVHEAFLFCFFPLVAGVLFVREGSAKGASTFRVVALCAPALLSVLVVLVILAAYGAPSDIFADRVAELRGASGFKISVDAVRVLFMTSAETAEMLAQTRWNAIGAVQAPVCMAIAVAWSYPPLLRLWRSRSPFQRAAVLVWPSTFAMFALGHDYVRWTGLAILSAHLLGFAAEFGVPLQTPPRSFASAFGGPARVAAFFIFAAAFVSGVSYANVTGFEPFGTWGKELGLYEIRPTSISKRLLLPGAAGSGSAPDFEEAPAGTRTGADAEGH